MSILLNLDFALFDRLSTNSTEFGVQALEAALALDTTL